MLAPPVSDINCAVLKIDAELNEEEIVFRLQSEGIADIFAASTQTFFLDDFGEIKQIPLNQYDQYLFDFDPRNDGYAEKLNRFFSQEGKRYIFIPLKRQESSSQVTIKKIDALLENIPHEIEFIGTAMPKRLPWLVFFAAFAGIVLFFKKLRVIAGIFPPMAAFIFWGASGFILAALLCVFCSVLINPLSEWFSNRRAGTKKSIRENFSLYPYSWILAAVCFMAYTAVMIVTNTSLLYSSIAFIALWGFMIFILRNNILFRGASKRRRFMPIPISKESRNVLHHALSAFPFTIAAVILLFASIFMNQPSSNFEFDQSRIVTKEDFEAHIRFQQNFSFIPLGKTIDNYEYRTYQLGDDGLVFDTGMVYSEHQELMETPAFPLEYLIDHIQGRPEQSIRWFSLETMIPLGFFLCLSCFGIFLAVKKRGRKKMKSMYNEKRIAA
jgi:hypothetical protein